MSFLGNIFASFGKYSSTISNVGSAVTAIQSYLEDRKAAKETEKANQSIMQAAQAEADLAKLDAAQRADAARRDATRVRAQQITAYLKSGITLDGSPMLVANETQDQGNLNAKNILTNADYSARATMLRAEANKRAVKKADIWGTAFDFLGSASAAANAWQNAQKGA